MDSFFTKFLEKFSDISTKTSKHCGKNSSQVLSLGGRYFAFILEEIVNEYPELLGSINPEFCSELKLSKTKFYSDTEKEFTTSDGTKRRADLYFNEENSGKQLFIEIKWEDKPLVGQIDDYLDKVKDAQNKVYFSFLTLHDFSEEAKKVKEIPNCKYILCSDLLKSCHALFNKLPSKRDSGLLKLFINFLKDHTMSYSTEINEKALRFLLKNSIGIKNADSQGKVTVHANIQNIPELWKSLLGNLAILGNRFHNTFGGKLEYGNRPLPAFCFYSQLPYADDIKKIEAKNEENPQLLSTWGKVNAEKGWFSLYNQVSISVSKSTPRYIEFGFCFEYSDDIYLYSYVNLFKEYMEKKCKIDKEDGGTLTIPAEDVLYKQIIDMLKKQAQKWLDSNKGEPGNENLVKACKFISECD